MIRRETGDEFWLITQNDHAIVSGELARHFGAGDYSAPDQRAILATSLHDCGWPLHDDDPTLNPRGLPLDVFETPLSVGLNVWRASSERAAKQDPYAGLLVSLHSMWISVVASTPATGGSLDMSDPATRFGINKFQQAQVELQERLRVQIGMRTDEPRKYGLAEQSTDAQELKLAFDFRLLQAMDKLSLAICCTAPPAKVIQPLLTHPGGEDRPLRVARAADFRLEVDPWPFKPRRLSMPVPFRRVRSRPFESEEDFRSAVAGASVEQFIAEMSPS
jgi:hypothetical protein